MNKNRATRRIFYSLLNLHADFLLLRRSKSCVRLYWLSFFGHKIGGTLPVLANRVKDDGNNWIISDVFRANDIFALTL